MDHIQKLKAHATAGGPLLIRILVVQSGLRFFGPHLSELSMPLITGFNPAQN